MTEPLGINLPFTVFFTKSGVPYTPSPLPTATLEFADHTFLSPAPTLTLVRAGEFSYTLPAVSNTQGPAVVLTAFSSDSTWDGYPLPVRAVWEVATNDVVSIWAFLTSALTTVGSIGKYIVDYLAAIKAKTDTIVSGGGTFISPVAADGTVTLYPWRANLAADGLALFLPVEITINAGDTLFFNVGPYGSPILHAAATRYDANTAEVELTVSQNSVLFKHIGSTFWELTVQRAAPSSADVIQAAAGNCVIAGVIKKS